MTRWSVALFSLAIVVLTVDMPAIFGNATLLGMTAAVVVVAVTLALCVGRSGKVRALVIATTGPAVDERRLRGAFHRQSRPDTPGRPRARAPGSGR